MDLTERQFLNNLYYNYNRFSIRRIDIAIDDFNETPYFTPNQLLKICQKKRFIYGKAPTTIPTEMKQSARPYI